MKERGGRQGGTCLRHFLSLPRIPLPATSKKRSTNSRKSELMLPAMRRPFSGPVHDEEIDLAGILISVVSIFIACQGGGARFRQQHRAVQGLSGSKILLSYYHSHCITYLVGKKSVCLHLRNTLIYLVCNSADNLRQQALVQMREHGIFLKSSPDPV